MKKLSISLLLLSLLFFSCDLFKVDIDNIRIKTEQQKISILGVDIKSDVSVHNDIMAFGGYKSTYPDPNRGEYIYFYEKSLGNWEIKGNFYVSNQGYNNLNLSYYDSLLLVANSESTQLYKSHNGNWEADTILKPQISAVAINNNDIVIVHPGYIDFYQHDEDSWQKTSFESSPGYFRKVKLKENVAIVGDHTQNGHRGEITTYCKNEYWEFEDRVFVSDAEVGDCFATDIDISKKYIIAGEPATYGKPTGSAYIYKHDQDIWVLDEKISFTDTSNVSFFGMSVAISDSYALIGAQGDNEYGERTGAVFLYKNTLSGWTLKAKLMASDAQAWDEFGYKVEISENNDIFISSHGAQSIYYFRP